MLQSDDSQRTACQKDILLVPQFCLYFFSLCHVFFFSIFTGKQVRLGLFKGDLYKALYIMHQIIKKVLQFEIRHFHKQPSEAFLELQTTVFSACPVAKPRTEEKKKRERKRLSTSPLSDRVCVKSDNEPLSEHQLRKDLEVCRLKLVRPQGSRDQLYTIFTTLKSNQREKSLHQQPRLTLFSHQQATHIACIFSFVSMQRLHQLWGCGLSGNLMRKNRAYSMYP